MGDNLLPPNNNSNGSGKVPLKEHIEVKLVAFKEYIDSRLGALQDYIDARVIAMREYFDTRLEALEKATTLVASNLDKRFDSMNEFRGQLKDQTAGFPTRTEIDQQLKRIEEDIKILQESKARLEGKASQQSVNLAHLLSVIGITLALISLIRSFTIP